ncbi:MAG TPA: nucleoside phosphorylase [Lactobacillaceae bacterium]|jgi:uridine phosphorylase
MEFHPEFDAGAGLASPQINRLTSEVLPTVFVGSFSIEVIEALAAEKHVSIVAREHALDGWRNVYRWHDETSDFLFGHVPVGAVGAIGHLEEVITLGVQHVVAFGTVGLLTETAADVFIPAKALRDEGMSRHYTADKTGIIANKDKNVQQLVEFFKTQDLAHEVVTTWTTDAFYRETPKRLALAKSVGASVVEMEMAAFFAWAEFRGLDFYGFMHRADSLAGDVWDGAIHVGFPQKLRYFEIAQAFAQTLT